MTKHEQTYRLLNIGEVIEEGDEFYDNSPAPWVPVRFSVGDVFPNGAPPVRRALPQPDGFNAGSVQAIAKWLFNRDHDGGPDALYHPNQPAHWAVEYEAAANDLLALLAPDAAPLAALAMRDAAYDSLFRHPGFIRTLGGQNFKAVKLEDAAEGIRAIPLPDKAALTAAAMTLPPIKELVEALISADRMIKLDLFRMTNWSGDDFNQAVYDVAGKVSKALTALNPVPTSGEKEPK